MLRQIGYRPTPCAQSCWNVNVSPAMELMAGKKVLTNYYVMVVRTVYFAAGSMNISPALPNVDTSIN